MTKSKIHEYLMTLLIVVCIVIATVVCGLNVSVPTAYAESEDIQTRYEQTNVMNNLKGSTIAGKAFDIKDYPHNASAKPQIISFVEFCYSYYAEKDNINKAIGLLKEIALPSIIQLLQQGVTDRNRCGF